MKQKYVMGFDSGTGGMRVGIYDMEGHEIVFASTEYPTRHEHPGWAEQSPADWWNCLAASTHKALELSGIDKEAVGQFAATIKAKRPVEPYHGYGIHYSDEVVIRKEGKTSGKK